MVQNITVVCWQWYKQVSKWTVTHCQPYRVTSGQSTSIISKCTLPNSFQANPQNQSLHVMIRNEYFKFCSHSKYKQQNLWTHQSKKTPQKNPTKQINIWSYLKIWKMCSKSTITAACKNLCISGTNSQLTTLTGLPTTLEQQLKPHLNCSVLI